MRVPLRAFSTDGRVNSFTCYHIPPSPVLSCNYKLFCATALEQALFFQSTAHSFRRNGGAGFDCGLPEPMRSRQDTAPANRSKGRPQRSASICSCALNNLQHRGASFHRRSIDGCAIASNLAVVFHAASARRFGPGRADVVHYFLLRTTMAARQKNQVKIEGRPVWAEVSAFALRHNLRAIRDFVNPRDEKRKTPRTGLSIVKGNG